MHLDKDPFAGNDPAWGFMPRPELCLDVVGSFDFTNGLERARINHAGGPPARVIGSPTVGSNYIRFQGGACLEVDIFDDDEISIVTVSRLPFAPVNGAIVVGTYLNGTSPGTSVYYTSNKYLRVSADTADNGLLSLSLDRTPNYQDWWINVFTTLYEPAPADRTVINQRVYDEALVSADLDNRAGPRKPAARKFRFGDDYSGTFQDPVDLALGLLVRGLGKYDAPTIAKKNACAADVAAWCTTRSINPG